ncbi:hypothetical protein [Pedobacter panaciterrae]
MNRNIIASESFASSPKRHYFLDFKLAENNSNYIQITRSDQQPDLTYKTSRVNVFEKDFEFLIQVFAALFHSAAYQHQQDVGMKEIREQLKSARGIKNWPPGAP